MPLRNCTVRKYTCPFSVAMTWPKDTTHQPSRVASLTHGFWQEVAQGNADISEEVKNLGTRYESRRMWFCPHRLDTLTTREATLSITAQVALGLHRVKFALVQPPAAARTLLLVSIKQLAPNLSLICLFLIAR